MAVSNTPVEKRAASRYAPGRDVVEFKATPKMSTYLLMFTVADLESIEATGDNVFRLFAKATRPKAES